MSSPDEHRAFQYQELNKIDSALRSLRGLDLPGVSDAIKALQGARVTALGKLGLYQPRTVTLITALLGLSPGELRLFHDAELGWLAEAIESPNAQPVRRYVPDETALKIITGQLDHDEFMELAAPTEEPDN